MASVKLPTEEALEATLVSLQQKLRGYWQKHGQWGLADDLAQEGLLKALKQQHSWKQQRGDIDAFFYTVGLNAGKDLLKKEATQKRGKNRVQQEAHRFLYFKMGGILRRKRAKSDEPVIFGKSKNGRVR
jgi:DNA-directed RNA polymerase specialized sigma24 family protein